MIGCSNEREFPNQVELDDLSSTEFIYALEQKIKPSNNQVYCPTILYAWNHLKEITNSEFSGQNSLGKILDESNSHLNSLNQNEYNNNMQIVNNAVVVTSKFTKSLPFREEFKRNNIPLIFSDGQNVNSFGCSNCEQQIRSQIEVIHFENQEDFAVRIIPKDQSNEILLYSTDRMFTSLFEFYVDLQNKSNVKIQDDEWWRYRFLQDDMFEVPIVEFSINSLLKELEGVEFSSKYQEFQISSMKQEISLIFDQRGGIIESKAETSVPASADNNKPNPKKLIFDSQFLIVFKKKDSNNPYFMARINNSELLSQ